MKLGLTGDVTLGRKVDEFQQRRPPERVWGSVRDLLIRIAVTVSRYDRTPSCSGSGTDLQQSLSGALDRDLRNDRGFLFELDVTGAGEVGAVTLHPVETERCAVHGAEGRVAAWCRETMRERSEPFGTAGEYERAGEALRLAL